MAVVLHDCYIGAFPLTQAFGANPAAYKQFWPGGHEGLDFGCPNGVAIIAATQGLVIHAGMEDAWAAYGNFVEVWDDVQHCATLYGHLREVRVVKGQRVWVGQLLGFSDNTGHSTGPHLHFGLCLTDAVGNRLNKANGTAGWVNPNPPNASWAISNPGTPAYGPPVPPVVPPPPPVEPLPPKPLPPPPDPRDLQIAVLTAALASAKAEAQTYLGTINQQSLLIADLRSQVSHLQAELKRLTDLPGSVVTVPAESWWVGGLGWLRRMLGS